MRTPSPAASTMVRQRRALALMGTSVLRRRALTRGSSAAANPLARWERHYRRGRARFPAPTKRALTRFYGSDKSVSRRRKKRYTTEGPGTERAWLRCVGFPYGLIFHFGWENVVSGRPCAA